MCTYFAIYLYIPAHGITNLPYQYIFSEKRVFECAAFGLDNRRVNGMFYDYLVLYSDYRADIWYYLAHLHTQKIGILVIFLVNFR